MALINPDVCESFRKEVQAKRDELATNVSEFKNFRSERVKMVSEDLKMKESTSHITYWMNRDVRVQDNWAFLYAQKMALELKLKMSVVYCLVPEYMESSYRQYDFLIAGLKEVETECRSLDIPFTVLLGTAGEVLPGYVKGKEVGGLVTDFNPLRVPQSWVTSVKEKLPKDVPFCQVDAHNIVPVWEASPKLEYAARTIRGKITKQLPRYHTEFPPLVKHQYNAKPGKEETDWKAAIASLKVDKSVGPVTWAKGGTSYGFKELKDFLETRLKNYDTDRNNPTLNALSNISPWLHSGQISAARCVKEVQKRGSKHAASVAAYVEETVIRRELSDNFCHYQPQYDSLEACYQWAKDSLALHEKDKREHVYTLAQFDRAKTHEDLWNAAQVQLVTEGKLHGFMRMYWAKKILEWSPDAEAALKTALYFNDRYSLDGCDPSGYVGCLWSIGGIHDQGWREREVFGKIRYMNYAGCKRKFDTKAYVAKWKVTSSMPGNDNVKKTVDDILGDGIEQKKRPADKTADSPQPKKKSKK